jgi:hypothetical protein
MVIPFLLIYTAEYYLLFITLSFKINILLVDKKIIFYKLKSFVYFVPIVPIKLNFSLKQDIYLWLAAAQMDGVLILSRLCPQ